VRTELKQLAERGSREWEVVSGILDSGFLAHVGFAVGGQPFVIPMLYGRDDRTVYLHGAASSRLMRELHSGVPACLTVTLADGLVLARSAFNHSINYRSVVAFGVARAVVDPRQKIAALRNIAEHLLAGRWNDARGPNKSELQQTSVLGLPLEEASAKIRRGAVIDDDRDLEWPAWAGVLPLSLRPGVAQPDAKLAADILLPEYLRNAGRRFP
jgi:uncharacterized protein